MKTKVPTTPVTPTKTPTQQRRGFVMTPPPLPAAVLADDGRHANPAALIDAMSSADARTGSTGLAYVAAHTRAADITPPGIFTITSDATPEQAAAMAEMNQIFADADDPAGLAARVLAHIDAERAEQQALTGHAVQRCGVLAWCTETGEHEWHKGEPVQVAQDCGLGGTYKHDHTATPYLDAYLIAEDDRDTGQRGAGAAVSFGECELTAGGLRREITKILDALPRLAAMADTLDGKPPYVPPTDCDVAERVTCGDAKGAILNAYLCSSEWEGKPDGPTFLSVYAEPSHEDDLDYAKAVDLLAQLDAFRTKLAVMVDALGAQSTGPASAEPADADTSRPAGGNR
ncbi:hypothetical protein [Streptomyces sp. IBSBF 2435]|uniref:hypothetical protein n=1 Tax=Streptomyces sp. IBSBF 2435 TaxID=2903531 RepID=UPI002FDBD89B